jgi:hypothetical protein
MPWRPAHGGLHSPLHGAAEGNTALQLLGDVVGNQLGVDFRLAHFNDVQMHFAVGHFRQSRRRLLDVRALLADDHTRTTVWIVTRHFLCGRSMTILG